MNTQLHCDLDLDYRIDAFEEARRLSPDADLTNFLPAADHPGYLTALGELIRVEMDRDWLDGRPRPLGHYLRRFPELAGDAGLLRLVAFEDYRLRRQAGEAVTPEEYRSGYGVDTGSWPVLPLPAAPAPAAAPSDAVLEEAFPATVRSDQINVVSGPPPADPGAAAPALRLAGDVPGSAVSSWVESIAADTDQRQALAELERDAPESVKRWAQALNAMPEAGSEFLGFRLTLELGRGAFGRVFLAQQADLANRPVALKVATDIFEESQTLAQLQHTNIVPIYSFHRAGKLQAVCMPYCGSTTLADVLHHIQSRAGLPTSGRDLVTTVNGRKSVTRDRSNSGRWSRTAGDSGTAAVRPPSTVTRAGDSGSLPALSAQATDANPLSDTWKRLEGLSFTDAVLWLATRIVDGLAHAHEHGVLHRDLKPANILLTDDGQPMLLDFNLATHSALRTRAAGARIGGTLPYMSPEHMAAFRGLTRTPPDERSDIYSIGVILFALLTGRHPFPTYKGPVRETVQKMYEDRCRATPGPRERNPAVSPALDAIVRRCLAPDPANRYQKARHLQEDLERQMNHLPLKHAPEPSLRERLMKWKRRHPRLTSTASVSAIAVAAVVGLSAALLAVRENNRGLRARTEYADHGLAFRSIQALTDERYLPPAKLDDGQARIRHELERYGLGLDGPRPDWERHVHVRYLPHADRARLKEDVGELYFLLAKIAYQRAALPDADRDVQLCTAERYTELAEAHSGDRIPRAVLDQRARILEGRGRLADAARLRERLKDTPPVTARDHYLVGHWLALDGKFRDALPHLTRATQVDPESYSAWFVRGNAHTALQQPELAALSYSACITLRKDHPGAWLSRGNAYAGMRFWELALPDYSRALELDPAYLEARLQRASAYRALALEKDGAANLAAAEADLTAVIEAGQFLGRAYIERSVIRKRRGNPAGARADIEAAMAVKPADARSYLSRANAKAAGNPFAPLAPLCALLALADVEEALRLDPVLADAHQTRAHLLERLHRPQDCVATLDRVIELYPDSPAGWAGRGVMLARQRQWDAARRDARAALRLDGKAPIQYQVACIFAQTSRDNPADRVMANHLLLRAVQQGYGLEFIDIDHDFDPLRTDAKFKEIAAKAKELYRLRIQ